MFFLIIFILLNIELKLHLEQLIKNIGKIRKKSFISISNAFV